MKKQKPILIAKISIIILILLLATGYHTKVEAATLVPLDNQKVEYRASKLETNNGSDQLTVEVWIHNLKFKGIDIRTSYDNTLISPSSISTNTEIDVNSEVGIPSNFTFENDFGKYMDMFSLENTKGELRNVFSLLGSSERTGTNEYLKTDATIGDYVDISGDVLIGKMTFKKLADSKITTSTIALKQATTSPTTGIKLNIDGTDNYQAESLFEFTLALASENANLSNLVTTPTDITGFDKATYDYNLKLQTDESKISVTPTTEDTKSTLKINVPATDADGKIIYDADKKVTYIDKDLTSGTAFDVPLTELGGEDVKVTITVTAEDLRHINTYTITIHKAYATIKGSILTDNTAGIHKADVKIYRSDQAIQWSDMTDHEELDKTTTVIKQSTQDDGTYEIKISPGQYDLLIDKPGYADYIVTEMTLVENDEADMKTVTLTAGDINKDGMIEIEDISFISNNYDVSSEDSKYEERMDLTGDGIIDVEDLSLINNNYDKQRTIIKYEK